MTPAERGHVMKPWGGVVWVTLGLPRSYAFFGLQLGDLLVHVARWRVSWCWRQTWHFWPRLPPWVP